MTLNRSMRIWIVAGGEPLPIAANRNPRLLRAGTLARRLAQAGHEVTWWTSAFDHFRKRHHCANDTTVVWEGGTIRLLKSVGYRRNLSLMRFVEHAGVARKFASQARLQPPPDIILVSFPTIELAREGVRFGKAQGVPVLVDVRDLWPDVLVNVCPHQFRWVARLLLAPMTRAATFTLTNCTGIIGVSDGYLAWALRHANRLRTIDDAMLPLGYVAPASSDGDLDVARDRLLAMGIDPSRKLCWYVGTFGRHYDLAPVLQAASGLQQSGRRDIQFVISGDGDLGDRWRRLAAGADNVTFTGWLGANEINWLRAHASIGLQPYAEGAPQGLANKLFEYLSAGIPVVSSLSGENQRLIDEYSCGLTYRARDALDCLEKIRVLADDDDLRRAMGQRGKQLFIRQFDSHIVFDGLAAHLEAVAQRYQRRRRLSA
jgi:glycosyltransferase involved in cell wall biosynthesis